MLKYIHDWNLIGIYWYIESLTHLQNVYITCVLDLIKANNSFLGQAITYLIQFYVYENTFSIG